MVDFVLCGWTALCVLVGLCVLVVCGVCVRGARMMRHAEGVTTVRIPNEWLLLLRCVRAEDSIFGSRVGGEEAGLRKWWWLRQLLSLLLWARMMLLSTTARVGRVPKIFLVNSGEENISRQVIGGFTEG